MQRERRKAREYAGQAAYGGRQRDIQPIRTVAKWKPNKTRPRERPGRRWTDRVKEDLRRLGVPRQRHAEIPEEALWKRQWA